jgi:hypothetical protein
MSSDEVQRSLDITLGLSAPGAQSVSPFSGVTSQGASDAFFRGGLGAGLASVSLGNDVVPDATAMKTEGSPPVLCMFITGSENVMATCMGCIVAKGEKFCTRPKVGYGELDTHGVNAHA